MPKRSAEDEHEWAKHKDSILKLYVKQDASLSEVIRAMTRQGFTKTKPQYERSLKRWRISKNVHKEEWDFILGRLDERNGPTIVKVRGVVISQARVERQKLRKRETTFDRCVSQLRPSPRPRTPPGIEICTPPPNAEDDHLELGEQPEHNEALDEAAPAAGNFRDLHLLIPEGGSVSIPVDSTPSATGTTSASERVTSERLLQATPTLSPSSHPSPDITVPSRSELLYDYIRAKLFINDHEISRDIPITERDHLLCLEKRSTRELLSHGYHQLLRVFVQYTRPKDDLYDVVRASNTTDDLVLLRRLLLISRLVARWKHFGENLLLNAAEDGNQSLLVMLLDVGVNVNSSASLERPSYSIAPRRAFNALQIAVHGGYENLINILTSRGAQIFTGNRTEDHDFLDHAIQQDNLDFVKPFLAKAATSDIETTRKWVAVLIVAVQWLNGRIVNVLLEAGFNPYWRVHDRSFSHLTFDHESAFVAALSAASRTKYLQQFLKFPSHGLDEERCRERLQQLTAGYAFACSSGDVDLRNAILDTEWDPDEINHIMGHDYVQQCFYDALEVSARRGDCKEVGRLIQEGANPDYRRRDKDIRFMTPLGMAVLQRNVVMVRQLIAGGADVNRSMSEGHITPLYFAVNIVPNVEIVQLLVEAGANIDAPANSRG